MAEDNKLHDVSEIITAQDGEKVQNAVTNVDSPSKTEQDLEVIDDHGDSSQLKDDVSGGSEVATGADGETDHFDADVLSEVSDTGWETDLEIDEEKEVYDSTGKKTYVRACETIGIVPANHFIRCLTSLVNSIDLSHHYIGPKGAKAISISLVSNTAVTHLNLSYNGLGAEGGLAIIDMLKENCFISQIDLSYNNIGSPCAHALADMLSFNNTVTHCNFSGNNFDDKAVEPLGEIIKTTLRVINFNLSHNEFSETSGVVLGSAIAESEVLQVLDLSWNYLRRKGAIAIAQGLKSNQTLKTLNLSYNGFGTEGAIALADALKFNTVLTSLDITDNRILVDGVKAIAKVLPACETLETLKIGHNPMQLIGVIALLEALKSGTCSIKELALDGITVSLEVAKIIKDMQNDIAGLKISHGGTGGYKEPKPLPTPVEKLNKYAKENNVKLKDLFAVFDKDKQNYLTEETFRASLKHISAPLMGFEVLKLLKEFGKEMEKSSEEATVEEDGDEADNGGPAIVVDYNALLNAVLSLQ